MFLLSIPEEETGDVQVFTAAHYRARMHLRGWLWAQCNEVNRALNETPEGYFDEEQLAHMRGHVLNLAWCAYALDHA